MKKSMQNVTISMEAKQYFWLWRFAERNTQESFLLSRSNIECEHKKWFVFIGNDPTVEHWI